ncbi:MAG: 4a-hydroxytetrahydrobiopterin dehydratase [Casimicrobiaceae bacterium]|nr:4a-hydroxytetrahydrobiopterin dehydratase [Casimicrobiaceae bacterium]MCX8099103.1 4a-hydroxytetrahydrobiopterin dehydratase [Casimicrobiaceae bacterium]MDW8312361.1 4a-hydroxytetrahydrobiopterin dehydratase [Burkholderiales bacterium]
MSSPAPDALVALANLPLIQTVGSVSLNEAKVRAHLTALPEWAYFGRHIERIYRFDNYDQTIAFVNMIAAIARATNHHPDLSVHYNRVVVRYSTHDADNGSGGVTINDLICAARIDLALRLST